MIEFLSGMLVGGFIAVLFMCIFFITKDIKRGE